MLVGFLFVNFVQLEFLLLDNKKANIRQQLGIGVCTILCVIKLLFLSIYFESPLITIFEVSAQNAA